MTQEEKARAFDEIMEDAYALDDKPHRLFLTLLMYVDKHGYEPVLRACNNAHKLLERP